MDRRMQDTEMPPHTHTCILYTCVSRELKMQIISEVKVEKMAIEVGVQMRDVCWFWWAGVLLPQGVWARYTLCHR